MECKKKPDRFKASQAHYVAPVTIARCNVCRGDESPRFNCHGLLGFSLTRFTVHVDGSCCITFEFSDEDAFKVDIEQYH